MDTTPDAEDLPSGGAQVGAGVGAESQSHVGDRGSETFVLGFESVQLGGFRGFGDLESADLVEGGERGLIGVGEGVEVLLGRGDRGMAQAFLDDLEVCAAGEEP
ncbi:hypothetical protein F4557_007416 [Actinomadura catellatispora]|uniref:Uncharacterized protein n=1 Tax=Actinomadura livida TaxID=79909 RepID=A0A7W7ILR1_9ACTN|nr:hypothetical protein [Actinomadura catellatispora]